jgi:hypothetical protein
VRDTGRCDGRGPLPGVGSPELRVGADILAPDGRARYLVGPSWGPRIRTTVAPGERLTVSAATRGGRLHEADVEPSAPPADAPALREWPDAAPGLWWVVTGFVTLLVGSVLGWLTLVLRVARAQHSRVREVAGGTLGCAAGTRRRVDLGAPRDERSGSITSGSKGA